MSISRWRCWKNETTMNSNDSKIPGIHEDNSPSFPGGIGSAWGVGGLEEPGIWTLLVSDNLRLIYTSSIYTPLSLIIKVMAAAAAVTTRWVPGSAPRALCPWLHWGGLSPPFPQVSQVALCHLGISSPSGMSLTVKQATGTRVTRGTVSAVRKGRDQPYDWFAAGPKSHEATEKVRSPAVTCGPMGSLPNVLLSPIAPISVHKLTHGERKEGKDWCL